MPLSRLPFAAIVAIATALATGHGLAQKPVHPPVRSQTPTLKAPPSKEKDKGKKKGKKRKRGSIALNEPTRRTPSLSILPRKIACPEEMVAVAGRFCIDRYEATLVELETHQPLSPHYPPTHKLTLWSWEKWQAAREEAEEDSLARTMPLPPFPDFQRQPFQIKAMSWPGNLPSGYVSGELAQVACRNAGKRLCKENEWVTACRGAKQTDFPYGPRYRQDACNVFREDHPAHILHGNFSANHSDPRLNLIELDGKPLLRATGDTPSCASRWGDDEIYDMVGNLDEWIDDPNGTFAGGFYARATRTGCDARIRTHPFTYFDYSTGVRCCKDPDPPP
ncbi:MAG: SUMF1/EgtB/PvdO family nonheme iron enzyme [Myxococcales bacterium]|nr:SUMF1/EgtB/PvdO family nonheme iron enzyme [Polyangiaceae bacterium]MDW8248543.1 SUMF1/EgtB/PvdO family nonheme iron enzyme [Myxococcales bacterium]